MGQTSSREKTNSSRTRTRHGSKINRIETAPTFDSHFTLISPVSDLSDPSKFFERKEHRVSAPAKWETSDSKVVFRNVPPLPATSKKPMKKRGKKEKNQSESKPRRKKTSLAGCVIVSSEQAQKMRDITGNGKKLEKEDKNEKPLAAAVDRRKPAKGSYIQSDQGIRPSPSEKATEKKSNRSFSKDIKRLLHENESEAPRHPIRYQPGWSGTKEISRREIEETVTPLAHLESSFEKTIGSDENNHGKRFTEPVEPSPAVLKTEREIFQSMFPHSEKKTFQGDSSPLPSASLFSDTSFTNLESPDPDFAKQRKLEPEGSISTNNDVDDESAIESIVESMKEIFENTKQSDSTEDKKHLERAAIKLKREFPTSKSQRENFGVTSNEWRRYSAGEYNHGGRKHKREARKITCAIEEDEYRKIEKSKSEGSIPDSVNYTDDNSPSNWNMSSVGVKPLDNEALSNAAFLFSPSYAGGNDKLLRRQHKYIDSTFSISTFASRARLSDFSSRSAVTIPVSKCEITKSEELSTSSYGMEYKGLDFSGVPTVKKSNKHVRFSNSNETFQLSDKLLGNEMASMQIGVESPEAIANQSEDNIYLPDQVSSTINDHEQENATPQREGSSRWAYREEGGNFFATPKLGNTSQAAGTQHASSISRRFDAAKAKFSVSGVNNALSGSNSYSISGHRQHSYLTRRNDDKSITSKGSLEKNSVEESTAAESSIYDKSIGTRSVLSEFTEPCLKRVYTPSIDTKMSDITDPTFTQKKYNIEDASLAPSVSTSRSNCSTISSISQGSMSWGYREEEGKIIATPNVKGKHSTGKIQPAKSPMLRFNAAKNKFTTLANNSFYSQQQPPIRTSSKNLVSSRINQFNKKINSNNEEALWKNNVTADEADELGEADLSTTADLSLSTYTEQSSTSDIFSTLRRANTEENNENQPNNLTYHTRRHKGIDCLHAGKPVNNNRMSRVVSSSEVSSAVDRELLSINETNLNMDTSYDILKPKYKKNNRQQHNTMNIVNSFQRKQTSSTQARGWEKSNVTANEYGKRMTGKNRAIMIGRKAFTERSLNVQQ